VIEHTVVGPKPAPLESEPETLSVVEAEVIAIVVVTAEREIVLSERRDQRVAMLGFVIDDDPIEIEEDGAVHPEKY
jgi:hypothetical protein